MLMFGAKNERKAWPWLWKALASVEIASAMAFTSGLCRVSPCEVLVVVGLVLHRVVSRAMVWCGAVAKEGVAFPWCTLQFVSMV